MYFVFILFHKICIGHISTTLLISVTNLSYKYGSVCSQSHRFTMVPFLQNKPAYMQLHFPCLLKIENRNIHL